MISRRLKERSPSSMEELVFVLLLRAAEIVGQQADQLLRAQGLTSAQYNVLRILRGSESAGLPCSSICERMISHDPDMTRLLDRMEKRGMITRERQKDDRRVVKASITPAGLKLLQTLDQPVRNFHELQFRHIPALRLKALFDLLNEVCAGMQPQERKKNFVTRITPKSKLRRRTNR